MDALRDHLVRLLAWEEAHVGFDKAVDGLPPDTRAAVAPGFAHSAWQLLEHLRLAQKDLLDFCLNEKYVHALNWPDDYWPRNPAPASAEAWDESVADFRSDRDKLTCLVRDERVDLLARVPTGTDKQTYLRAVLLVVDHNAYHIGQLVALRRALGHWH